MARALERPRSRHGFPLRTAPSVVLVQLRRLRRELALVMTVAVVVLLTSLVAAAFPRLYNRLSDDGLRYAVGHAHVYERNIVMTHGERLAPSPGDPFAAVSAEGAQFQADLAPAVRNVIDHRDFVVDAPEYRFPLPAGQPAAVIKHVTLRYQSGVESHIQLVQGRMPGATSDQFKGASGDNLPVLETAVSQATADALDVKLGDRIELEVDPDEPLTRVGNHPKNIAIAVVGILKVTDPDADYWYNDGRIDQASVYDDGNVLQVYATGLFAPAAYGDLLNDVSPSLIGYSWRYTVDPQRFSAGQFTALTTELRRLDAKYPSGFSARPGSIGVSTQLSSILKQFAAGRRLTIAIVSLTGMGLLAMALATLGLTAGFVIAQRHDALVLLRGRGASARQLLLGQAGEGLLIALPSAVLGLLLALLLVHSRFSPWSLIAAGVTALAATAALVLAALPTARRPLGTLMERSDVPSARPTARRLVLEAFVVALAVGGVYLLRRRGLAGDSATARAGGFDPYLAAVPLLVGLAVGLLVRRLAVIPIRLLAWQAGFRRDLVPFLGFRRLARYSALTSIPLLVLLLSVAVSVFSSVLMNSIQVGQVASSWAAVGSDFRVDTIVNSTLPRNLDLTTIPGVQAVATAYRADGVVPQSNTFLGATTLLAVDTTAFETVTAGEPVDPHFPGVMLDKPPVDAGTAAHPVPAIVSSHWGGQRPPRAGDVFSLDVERQKVNFTVTEVRDSFAGLPDNQPFVIAALPGIETALAAQGSVVTLAPTTLFVRGSQSAAAPLRQLLKDQAPLASLISRQETYDDVHDSPLIAGSAAGFRFGLLVAAAYSALAVGLALALTNRSRQRDLGFLRTLGLTRRQSLGLIVAEQAPTTALGLIVGVVLGIVVLRLTAPGLDLRSFTNGALSTYSGTSTVGTPLVVDRLAIAGIALALIATVSLAVAVVNLLVGRLSLGSVLRIGE